MSAIEASFDSYRKELEKMLGKIDVDLAIKIMYLERKLPDVEPKVELDLKIKNGIDPGKLGYELCSKYGMQSAVHKNHLILVGRATIDDVFEISKHEEVEYVSGSVTAASY